MSDISLLLEKAKQAHKNAYAPYSNFHVGACIETSTGKLFAACNVENASYGLSICAESNAISAMIAAGEKKIKQVVVVVTGPGISTCCGACRQRINEFAAGETLIHFYDLAGDSKTYRLDELLPKAFGPKDVFSE